MRPATQRTVNSPYHIDLSRHLRTCDGNYLRLSRLMPGCDGVAPEPGERRTFQVALGACAPTVVIEVASRTRYTTVLRVVQFVPRHGNGRKDAGGDAQAKVRNGRRATSGEFNLDNGDNLNADRRGPLDARSREPARAVDAIHDLRMTVRLYHDVRSAEVIECEGKRAFASSYVYPNPQMRQPDEKAQLNRFLAEFLNACFRYGVACPACTAGNLSPEPVSRSSGDSVSSDLEHSVPDDAASAKNGSARSRPGRRRRGKREPVNT